MNNKECLLKELRNILEKEKLKPFYRDALEILYNIYRKISISTVIEDYFIDKKQHYISFGVSNSELSIELVVNGQYIELRFCLIEVMLFEEDKYHHIMKNKILESYFCGAYKVIYSYNHKKKVIFKELYWDDVDLIKYNIIKNNKVDVKYSRIYKGKSLL